MKAYSNIAILTLAFSLLTGCETTDTKEEAASTDTKAVSTIAEAKAAFDEVNELGYAWRDTEEMIKSAEEAAKLGDTSTADSLSKSALDQSRLAKEQYEAQKNAGPY